MVVEGFDPIMSVFVGGEQWYQDIKNAVGALLYAVDWLSAGTKSLYGMYNY